MTDELDRLKLNYFSMIDYNLFLVYMCCVTVFVSGSNVVNQYSLLYFSALGKREGINFHYMYTEIIKSRSSFEELPIPVTPFCLNY